MRHVWHSTRPLSVCNIVSVLIGASLLVPAHRGLAAHCSLAAHRSVFDAAWCWSHIKDLIVRLYFDGKSASRYSKYYVSSGIKSWRVGTKVSVTAQLKLNVIFFCATDSVSVCFGGSSDFFFFPSFPIIIIFYFFFLFCCQHFIFVWSPSR